MTSTPSITSGATGISQRTNVYASMKMLEHAAPVVVLDKMAKTLQMPKNKSQLLSLRRPVPFAAATTALTEGVTPAARAMQFENVQVQLRQYGEFAIITDVIEDTHEDPVLNELTVQLGENIGRTMEALLWAELRAGTNVMYANGSARNAVNTTLSIAKQRKAVQTLKRNKASHIREVLTGSPDYETRPVEAAFVAVCHTDLEADIRSVFGAEFVPVSKYGTRSVICPEEIGTFENVRYILSPDLTPFADAGGAKGSMKSTTGTSADVYPVLYMGRDAYATVALRGMGAVEPTIIPVGQKDKSDPLGQRGMAGWKTWFAAKILNDAWLVRLECAATEL